MHHGSQTAEMDLIAVLVHRWTLYTIRSIWEFGRQWTMTSGRVSRDEITQEAGYMRKDGIQYSDTIIYRRLFVV